MYSFNLVSVLFLVKWYFSVFFMFLWLVVLMFWKVGGVMFGICRIWLLKCILNMVIFVCSVLFC